MIHILQEIILIVCLFTLNCVVLIILPLYHAPLASPLIFSSKSWRGGGRRPQAPPPYGPVMRPVEAQNGTELRFWVPGSADPVLPVGAVHKCFGVEIYYCFSLQIHIIASAGCCPDH